MHMCGGQKPASGASFNDFGSYYPEAGCLAEPGTLLQLDWLAHRPPESACLYPSSSGGLITCSHVWLFTSFLGIQTSSPHACVTSTELPSQLCHDVIVEPGDPGADKGWQSYSTGWIRPALGNREADFPATRNP